MFCKKCGNKLPENASFCNKCGNKIEVKKEEPKILFCKKCGNKLIEGASFCNKCGNRIGELKTTPKVEIPKTEEKVETPKKEEVKVTPTITQTPQVNNAKDTNSTNKKLMIAIAVVVLFIIIIGSFGKTTGLVGSSGGRTIMIYMVGADLESEKGGLASRDLQDLDYSKTNANGTRVILMAGGSRAWKNNYISPNETSIYELRENGFVKVDTRPIDNMGSISNLSYFLDYAATNYKADKYNFIFWNHGGAVDGSEYDEISRDNLQLSEMKKAFDGSTFKGNNKLETISFRTCLNGTIEVANVYKDYAKYLVASEEITIGSVLDSALRFINDVKISDSPEEFGKKQIATYKEVVTNTCNYGSTNASSENYCCNSTYSIVNLSKIDNVNKNIDNFAKELNSKVKSNYQNMSRLRANMGQYAAYANQYQYDMIDLYDLANKYKSYSPSAEALMKSVEDAVEYNWTNNNYSNGLSIYFPYNENYFIGIYKDIATSSDYTNFITTFYALKTSQSSSASASFSTLMDNKMSGDIKDEKEANFEVELTDDQVKNFAKASYLVFADSGDGYQQLLYSGKETKLDGNKLKATIKGKQLKVSDIDYDDQTYWLTLVEEETTDEYTDVSTYVLLQNSVYDSVVANMIIRIDKEHPNGYIKGLYSTKNDNDNKESFAANTTVGIRLKDYRIVSFGSQRYKVIDEDGNYNQDWDKDGNGIHEGMEYVNDEFKFIQEDFPDDYKYYAVFTIYDTSNNIYRTKAIEMKG